MDQKGASPPSQPLIFASNLKNSYPMYIKFVRHNQLGGNVSRGSLYTVHFEPNEKGGYNEHPSLISDAYEIASGADYPPALIYQAEVRRVNGHMRLSFGRGDRQSLLHLIDRDARERFFAELLDALRDHEDVRIETAFGKWIAGTIPLR